MKVCTTIMIIGMGLFCIPNSAFAQHQEDASGKIPVGESQHLQQDAAASVGASIEPALTNDVERLEVEKALDRAASGPPKSWPEPVHDNPVLNFVFLEQLEFRASAEQPDEFGWDAQGWLGNDDHKFWWKTEGEIALQGTASGDAEFQALYATPIAPFWYGQIGLLYENQWENSNNQGRTSLVLGVQGLAPYRFELEPTLFLTEDGDILGRLTASYDMYIMQRLVLQPRTEINLSAQDVPRYDIGDGLNDGTLELRLRYEFEREFAPYVGVRYNSLLGETANIAESDGFSADDLQFVFGFRIAF